MFRAKKDGLWTDFAVLSVCSEADYDFRSFITIRFLNFEEIVYDYFKHRLIEEGK